MVSGRRAAAEAAREVGGKILEVGVGTGLSFDDCDFTTEITGIDLSAPMLAKARRKMASGRYPYVKDVRLMDAHQMNFADAAFDCVVAQFVITLVANPEQVLSECHRVVSLAGASSSLTISIRKPASPRRWSAGRPSVPARWACGPSFRLRGCRPGHKPTTAPTSWSGARSRRLESIRWSVSSERRFRRRRDQNMIRKKRDPG
jgi:SAM-dependent methyltransferase